MSERATRGRFPPSIKYLAWNEAAERFSYYGMTSILTLYMWQNLGIARNEATARYQYFTAAVYLMAVVGGWLADRVWGRYATILSLSLGYVAGHAVLAFWETPTGLLVGLALIALGAGGIKANASAFAGDQIPSHDQRLLARLYDLYYWMINLGSTAATLVIPYLRDHVSIRAAFGLPGIAMAIALFVFWLGRRTYVIQPPASAVTAEPEPDGRASRTALLRIAAVFAPVAAFWALFFQYGGAWTVQAELMNRTVLGREIPAGSVPTLNALFVMMLIPAFGFVLFPALERVGIRVTPLRKMTAGMFVMVLSFVAAALVDAALARGEAPHVAWQVPQYLLLSIGEVLVSVTALDFAYSQAPRRLKSVVMGLWYLTIWLGTLFAGVVAQLNIFEGVAYYVFFAVLMLAAAIVFAFVAWWYKPVPAASSAPAAA
jgi:proton-dependent oligopeptide transporter, POT family